MFTLIKNKNTYKQVFLNTTRQKEVINMIPNCEGCEVEIEEAIKYQKAGFEVGLEGMGKKSTANVLC